VGIDAILLERSACLTGAFRSSWEMDLVTACGGMGSGGAGAVGPRPPAYHGWTRLSRWSRFPIWWRLSRKLGPMGLVFFLRTTPVGLRLSFQFTLADRCLENAHDGGLLNGAQLRPLVPGVRRLAIRRGDGKCLAAA